MDITHHPLLGGIALFLYGMSIMGAGLRSCVGGKMQGVLQKLTSSTIKGGFSAPSSPASSSRRRVMVVICVGLVNSGIMTLTQAGVIMGANIVLLSPASSSAWRIFWLLRLWLTLIQPKTFAPVVALLLYVFLRNAKKKNIGQIMPSFGILFTA